LKNILVTGAAGFIGYHVANLLCDNGYNVIGIDSVNDYYNTELKNARIAQLADNRNFRFLPINLCEKDNLDKLFAENGFEVVINLAAQAGVRYSLEKPYNYIDSNITGFMNILEACRTNTIKHLLFASSSSVYGANTTVPFDVDDNTDHPLSLYAATKKANEAMAHSYASLYNIPCTGLRFFTVYGPWGRPDMAYHSFTKNIIEGTPIKVFNNGDLRRDFTYVDDIVNVISLLIDKAPVATSDKLGSSLKPSESYAPYKLYNIGNNNPVNLLDFINTLEDVIGKKAILEKLPMQKGDMYETYANIDSLIADTGYKPSVDIRTGLTRFVEWYKMYYSVK
jgi:UDP-glucuronate 4-epimerase